MLQVYRVFVGRTPWSAPGEAICRDQRQESAKQTGDRRICPQVRSLGTKVRSRVDRSVCPRFVSAARSAAWSGFSPATERYALGTLETGGNPIIGVIVPRYSQARSESTP